MSPDNVVAALGFLCGAGRIEARHGEDWSEIRANLDGWDQPVITLTDLFLLLTADETR